MNDVIRILETGSSSQKIKALESLATTDVSAPDVIKYMISKLDDDDIRVRGEAFSSLLLNQSEKTSEYLIKSLSSESKNIRGFASLALANRNDRRAIPELIRLVCDKRSMVRSCAIGALGYLKADSKDAQKVLYNSLFDENIKVQKSAAHAIIRFGTALPTDLLGAVSEKWTDEIRKKEPDLAMLLDKLRAMQRQ